LRRSTGRRLRLVAVHPQPPNMSIEQWRAALSSLPAPGSDHRAIHAELVLP
jgi:hypothetical protein